MSRISFDFDDTLLMTVPDEDAGIAEAGPNEKTIALLRAHAAIGNEVVIVTTRLESNENRGRGVRVRDFVAEHKLPVSSVHFTNMAAKVHTLVRLGVDLHFDDDIEETNLFPPHIRGVLVPLLPAWGLNFQLPGVVAP